MSILVAGSLHLDIVLRAPHLPKLDETVPGSSVDYVFGGKGGNQAVAAARMGADVAFAGRVGGDQFGKMLRDALLSANVDIQQLQSDTGASGMSAAIVDENGDYGAVIVSAANQRLAPEMIEASASTQLVVLQNETPDAANLAVAQKAHAAGAAVWLNAAPARPLASELCEVIDLFIVNRVEAEFYGEDLPVSRTLTTLGAQGVRYGGATYPGHTVAVTSTHGAGDMFVGALAAQFVAGTPLNEAIGFAQSAAALHVSLPVAKRERITRDRVAQFAADHSNR